MDGSATVGIAGGLDKPGHTLAAGCWHDLRDDHIASTTATSALDTAGSGSFCGGAVREEPIRRRSRVQLAKRLAFAIALALAILASASTWFYVNRILRAQQIADAAVHNRPRGNLSDLYPRWLGARELLRHGRNPYSPEITREIQQGYYGRPLDPSRPDDPKDQQGFAYPVYVVFLLAPTVDLPFETVQTAFRWLLIALAAVSVCLWLRALRWKLSFEWFLVLALFMVGWLPMVQGIKLQQLSLLVAGLLAA